ncbi:MAG: phosphotransferase [Lachnospiraceae bacterium]|nr:phosphotransferase [Lachnospiraceae bacterium]
MNDDNRETSVRNAIILAAGYGMRMVPADREIPKGLLEVYGEPLIERLIKQLQEAGISEIYVVAGYKKEKFEYLIKKFGVKLIFNAEYAEKNSLYSLKAAAGYLSDSYIIPCDVWCKRNPFRRQESGSWYMVGSLMDKESLVQVDSSGELVLVPKDNSGNTMIGISYLAKEQAAVVRDKMTALCRENGNAELLWEEALLNRAENKMMIRSRLVDADDVVEINTYEQLRELDKNSSHLQSDAIAAAAEIIGVGNDEIVDISVLKKGMTNRSFLFSCRNRKYIMRIPGEGTQQLIDRRAEAEVYQSLKGKGICDNVIYMNAENGYKITEFIEGTRVCDPFNPKDLVICMEKLRAFHEQEFSVEREFHIFEQIEFYEALWGGKPSAYQDYETTKERVMRLQSYINAHTDKKVLTHIDAVPDNFLIMEDEKGACEVRIIDWEYAGMQDPHIDIAMFCIYSMYEKEQVDNLIDIYFQQNCPDETRVKIYCYIAACGLLWSNWCEYKAILGVKFGEYSQRQYDYAREYYQIVQDILSREEDEGCIT